MTLLVSACLLGRNCKYSGGNNLCPKVVALAEKHRVVEICPEMMAGLGTPRTPVEIVNGILMDRDGNCVDTELRRAAEEALIIAREAGIDWAVLQSRSPTCGVNQIYDGSFSGKLIPGQGVFARMLMDAGFSVVDAEDVEILL